MRVNIAYLRRAVLSGWFTALGVMMVAQMLYCQDTRNFPTIGRIVREKARFDELIAPDAQIVVLASGFQWAEGPLWIRDRGCLLFSDIPNNRVLKWREGHGIEIFLEPSGYTGAADYGDERGSNGLLLDHKGRLISCEHGDRRISVMDWIGGKRTLVDSYQGRRLNSPNDAVYRSDGDLYFTDPPYGFPKKYDDPRRELDFCGVYRLSKDGQLSLVSDEMTRPNGLAFSPDESTLYVAQSDPEAALWKAFPVQENGQLGPSRVFYDATSLVRSHKGLPDGLKVDAKGNIFATGPGGVYVFAPDGTLLGRIDPGEATANCAWGNDGGVLYITADMYLCRIQTKTKGAGWIQSAGVAGATARGVRP